MTDAPATDPEPGPGTPEPAADRASDQGALASDQGASSPPITGGPPAGAPAPPEPLIPAPPPASPSLVSDGLRLEWHIARPPRSAARGAARTGLVIAHGMPIGEGSAATAALTFPELADRVARDAGWLALSFSFRGAGRSPGSFSPGAWLRDLRAAVELLRLEVDEVFLAGFGLGGTLALKLAAEDPAIGGVALLATPSDVLAWSADLDTMVSVVTEAGYLHGEPTDLDHWAEDLRSIDPLGSAAKIPPRPFLIVHGAIDDEVSLVDARALSDASEGAAELRVIPMAAHRLRHDPRAVALLLGWVQRHG